MTVSGIAPPNGAEIELLDLLRRAREAREAANHAAEAAKDAKSFAAEMHNRAEQLWKDVDAAFRKYANPESE